MDPSKRLWTNFLGVILVFSICLTSATGNGMLESQDPFPGIQADDSTLGYDITVGVEAGSLPADPEAYLNNFWTSIDTLSEEMFRATRKHFYIRSVQLIVPKDWDVDIDRETEQSYGSADIRISFNTAEPRAENPNACGLPGTHIELPLDFFQPEGDDELRYGTPWKALLHLWARYRYGAWEEHGFAYSTRFPYSSRRPGASSWSPTGCSNVPISGEYFNETESCDNNGDYAPNPDCRFFPHPNNTATSSLMHYHDLPSVVDFCDSETHDKESPNKQNTFCQQRSVWEVIEGSPEFNSGESLLDERPGLVRLTLKTTQRPLFYMLLDRGFAMVDDEMISQIKGNLSSYLSQVRPEVMAGIGMFPGPDSVVEEMVPWTTLGSNIGLFESTLDDYDPTMGPKYRNYGAALQMTIGRIKRLNHAAGALILVLKTGDGETGIGELPVEEELLAGLKESNIKVYGLEIQVNLIRPGNALEFVAQEAEGSHVIVESKNSINRVRSLLNEVKSVLREQISRFKYRYLYKGTVEPDDVESSVTLVYTGLNSIQVSLTLGPGAQAQNLTFRMGGQRLEVETRAEWMQTNNFHRRTVYYGSFQVAEAREETTVLQVEYNCEGVNCGGILLAQGDILLESQVDELRVTISTSAHNGALDLGASTLSTTPFAVFAKVESAYGRPVKNIQRVIAMLEGIGGSGSYKVELKDDGLGTPDTLIGDGIYSGAWVPPEDGSYSMSVSVFHDREAESRLMPIDQDFYCETGQCNGFSPSESLLRHFMTPTTLTVVNSPLNDWLDKPAQILDLNAWPTDGFKVLLTWTAPPVFNTPNNTAAESYEIQIGSSIEEAEATVPMGIIPGEPGTKESWTFNNGTEGSFYYFAIMAKSGTKESHLSRIVGSRTRETELITTTMTPPEPPTTPVVTTEAVTRPPTFPTSSSSPGSSTAEPTTERSKTWIEKPEGYVTLIVFGAAVVIMGLGAVVYRYFSNRTTQGQGFETLP